MAKAIGNIIGGVLNAVGAGQSKSAANQGFDASKASLNQASKLTGTDPAVQAQIMAQYKDMIRGAQADRGIFSSGPAVAQESYLMPQIEQGFRNNQYKQLMDLSGGYNQNASGRAGTINSLNQQQANGWGQFGMGVADTGMNALMAMFGKPPTSSGTPMGPAY